MPAKRKKTRTKSASRFRGSWRGQLRFGLVSFEVQAVNAENKEHAPIHFHLLHKPDNQRIHYSKVCPRHGEVPNGEIIEGYEYAKGKYVEIEKEELDALRTTRERALTIDAFVKPDEIDPLYFDGRMYYLIPSGAGAAEAYCLLEAAMENKARWGIGQVVFSGREQLALVRPVQGVLTMAMLNYEAEIRKPAEMKKKFTRSEATARQLRLAEQLVDEWHEGRFDFSGYEDRYREKVKQALDAKLKGMEVSPPPEEEEPTVINLMDALKRSLASSKKKATPRRHQPAAKTAASKKHSLLRHRRA